MNWLLIYLLFLSDIGYVRKNACKTKWHKHFHTPRQCNKLSTIFILIFSNNKITARTTHTLWYTTVINYKIGSRWVFFNAFNASTCRKLRSNCQFSSKRVINANSMPFENIRRIEECLQRSEQNKNGIPTRAESPVQWVGNATRPKHVVKLLAASAVFNCAVRMHSAVCRLPGVLTTQRQHLRTRSSTEHFHFRVQK